MPKNNEINSASMDSQLKKELEIYTMLKPFIGHCLTLNHDINNPLAGIIGYTEFLLMDDHLLSQDQKHQIQQISDCAERIRKIVEDLCADKIELSEKLDLSSVIEMFEKSKKKL